jgi:hypothetical protein
LSATYTAFAAGLLTMGYLIASLFFLRFWSRTRDSLFACFCIAFLLLAANQALPALLNVQGDDQAGLYLLRLAAFATIIIAIFLKNMPRSGNPH